MHDHLKDAAIAAAMSDDELVAAFYAMDDPDDPTGLQQAIIDEMGVRRIPEVTSPCWLVPAKPGVGQDR